MSLILRNSHPVLEAKERKISNKGCYLLNPKIKPTTSSNKKKEVEQVQVMNPSFSVKNDPEPYIVIWEENFHSKDLNPSQIKMAKILLKNACHIVQAVPFSSVNMFTPTYKSYS